MKKRKRDKPIKIKLIGTVTKSHVDKLGGTWVTVVDEVQIHTTRMKPKLSGMMDGKKVLIKFGWLP